MLIHPENRFKKIWDALILFLTVFTAIEIPLRITLEYPITGAFHVFDVMISMTFLTDVILNFFSKVLVQNRLLEDRKEIALYYLKGWFIIDFISAVPLDLIFGGGALAETNRILRLFRLTRLLRLVRLAQFMKRWGKGRSINPSILRLVFMFFWIVLGSHLVACVWLLLGAGLGPNDSPDPNLFNRYLRSLYWVTTTITTIGYGDISPNKEMPFQTIYTMFIQLMGAGMYGFIIGNIANLIANIDVAKAQHREKVEKINTFMKYKQIPEDIQEKVQDYYNYLWESRRGYDELSIIEDLPAPLKTDISLILNRNIIEKVPFFQGASPDFITEIVLNLFPVVFTPGDYVFRKGEVGQIMYFISKGEVEVVSEDGNTVYATLREGNFFGEIALLLSSPRTASIRAREYCDLYTLDKETFDRVLRRYPDFEKEIREMARKRKEEIEKDRGVTKPESAEMMPEEINTDLVPGKIVRFSGRRYETEVHLYWEAPAGAHSFTVIRKEGKKWLSLKSSIGTPSFIDKEGKSSDVQVYRVRAENATGVGEWSDALSITMG